MAARPLDAACVAPSGLPQGARTRAGHDWATRGSDCWTRAEVDGAKRSPPTPRRAVTSLWGQKLRLLDSNQRPGG